MKSAIARKPVRSIVSSMSTFRHGQKAGLPFKLKFESSSVCNLKCGMCPLNSGLKRKQGFLKFDNFKKVFDQIKPAYLNLTGIGEPFLNPDIFDIIKYAKKNKAMVKFDTNAMLLNEENITKILETGVDVLSISIDGTTKKSYEQIRVGGNFDTVRQNVKRLVEERNKVNSSTEVHMFFVLQAKNIQELPNFVKLADELGVNYVAGSFVVNLGDNKNEKNKIFDYKEKVDELVRETEEAVKNAKAKVSIEPLLEYIKSSGSKEFYNEDMPCFMPWYSVFITWDGWVNPCDFSCDNEIVFGNVFEKPFKEIWNNEKLKNFRIQLLNSRKEIPLCKNCGVNESYIEDEFKKIRKIPFLKRLQNNKNS
ncbi:MAG: radical SAM protein [Candidatus Nanoarchaeia archaeon]|nr:radical SAM protein [Candidatus Nanoarchaeia archaeon]MDD5358155.1 radical SAM protein [Candidatus Nanoarchaeia archaeon]MDD5589342.1 radical SAM protein [Candidatus Nanoarchaeia archaeon]